MNLLFSCAGRRAYLLKYFRAALDAVGGGKIFATDMSLTAPALAFADVALRVPAVYAEDYTGVVEEICRKNKIDALISLNDLELPILAAARERFEKIGTRLIISSPEVIDICFDKLKTARFAESLGLNTPRTFVVLQDALSALDNGELVFPLILKPRWGSGSIGIEFVRDREELLETYEIVRRKVARSILSTASAREEEILIQQAITDAEYGLDVMNDLDGNTVAVSVKRKLAMRAGETDKAVTADNAEIREIGFKIGKALRHVANLDCDVLERDGRYYVLELNPRFGGGYPFSQEAGVNLPLAILKWLRGENVGAELLTAKPNVAFAKCDILTEIPPPENCKLRRGVAFAAAFRCGFRRDNAFRFDFRGLSDSKNTNAIRFAHNERSAA
ncbi:MAG: ATP-grasp domain-containing protein [Opitutales bacterium]|nr:ATP-grasp domain-containing protein [Opitutales bacterium]